jgi:hypothetical protein
MDNRQGDAFEGPQMEAKMRKIILRIIGLLAVSTFTVQMAIAAPHSPRKAARLAPPVTHQFRNAFSSAPKAVESKSCDIIWCYEN